MEVRAILWPNPLVGRVWKWRQLEEVRIAAHLGRAGTAGLWDLQSWLWCKCQSQYWVSGLSRSDKSLASTNGDLVSILSAEEQQTAVKKHSKLFHPRVIHAIYQMLITFSFSLEARFILSTNKSWLSLSRQPKDEQFEFQFSLLFSFTRTH